MSPKSPMDVIPFFSIYLIPVRSALSRSSLVRFGKNSRIAAVASSFSTPVGRPAGSSSITPPGMFVSFVIPAAFSAASLANPTCPHTRVVHTRAPSNLSVSHAVVGVSPSHSDSSHPCPITHFVSSSPSSPIAPASVSMNSSFDRTVVMSRISAVNPPAMRCAWASTKPLANTRPAQSTIVSSSPRRFPDRSTATIRPDGETMTSRSSPSTFHIAHRAKTVAFWTRDDVPGTS